MHKLVPCASALLLASSLALAAAPPVNPGVKDANAALDALAKGDNVTAFRLLTRAIAGGKLTQPDMELAFVTRAQAYIAQHNNDAALKDLDQAFAIDPSDKDIADLRSKAGWKPPGPTLAEVLLGVQQGLAAPGAIAYTAKFHDSAGSADFSEPRTLEVSAVAADPAACQISFHFKATRRDAVFVDKAATLSLHDVAAIELAPKAKILDHLNADAGHPSWTAATDPDLFTLTVAVPGGSNEFDFKDEASANQVGAAISAAAKQCGGSPAPFVPSVAAAPAGIPAPVPADAQPNATATVVAPTSPAPPPPQAPMPPPVPVDAAAKQPASGASPVDVSPKVAPAPEVAAAPAAPDRRPDPATAQAAPSNADALNSQVRAFNAEQDAKFQAAEAKFKADQEEYQRQMKAVEDAKTAIAAKKAADDAAYAAQLAAWQARVKACNAGDRSQCGTP